LPVVLRERQAPEPEGDTGANDAPADATPAAADSSAAAEQASPDMDADQQQPADTPADAEEGNVGAVDVEEPALESDDARSA
jgi:hypothetical protein